MCFRHGREVSIAVSNHNVPHNLVYSSALSPELDAKTHRCSSSGTL